MSQVYISVASAIASNGMGLADLTASSIEPKSSITFFTRSWAVRPRSVRASLSPERHRQLDDWRQAWVACAVAIAFAQSSSSPQQSSGSPTSERLRVPRLTGDG